MKCTKFSYIGLPNASPRHLLFHELTTGLPESGLESELSDGDDDDDDDESDDDELCSSSFCCMAFLVAVFRRSLRSSLEYSGNFNSHSGDRNISQTKCFSSKSPMTSQNGNVNQCKKVAFYIYFEHFLTRMRKIITTLREGRGNLILVSKICNIQDSPSLVVDCKSWTLGWNSLFSLLRQEYPPNLMSEEMLSHPGG